MKYTVLDLVQTILSRMDSDEVNSINDTVEAQQVATIIRSVYFDIISRADLPEHYSLVTLNASADSSKPVLMSLPSSVASIKWLKYDVREASDDPINMQLLRYLPLSEFLTRMHSLDTDETDVDSFSHTIGSNTFTILYKNNKAPEYYTTFDDNTVLFDSLDTDVDSTLQQNKTLCYGKNVVTFTLSDNFTPSLDEEQFALLLNESLSTAWAELKQTQHPIADRNSRRGWTHLQKSRDGIKGLKDFDKLPYFGRK